MFSSTELVFEIASGQALRKKIVSMLDGEEKYSCLVLLAVEAETNSLGSGQLVGKVTIAEQSSSVAKWLLLTCRVAWRWPFPECCCRRQQSITLLTTEVQGQFTKHVRH